MIFEVVILAIFWLVCLILSKGDLLSIILSTIVLAWLLSKVIFINSKIEINTVVNVISTLAVIVAAIALGNHINFGLSLTLALAIVIFYTRYIFIQS